MESYRDMIAFRSTTEALLTGRTRFFDLPEPVLGFLRGDGLLCLFNLSPNPVTLAVTGESTRVGPSQAAALQGNMIDLGGNGFAFLTVTGEVTVTA